MPAADADCCCGAVDLCLEEELLFLEVEDPDLDLDLEVLESSLDLDMATS